MSLFPGLTAARRSWLVPVGVLTCTTLAGAALFMAAQQSLTGNLWGVPVDDAYIHFQYARNLAGGHGFAFNPDQPMPGSTSPLWVLLLALGGALGAPLWLVAKVWGILFLCLAGVAIWRLAGALGAAPLAALAAGALTTLDGRLLWAAPSGMEVTLFAALSTAAVLARVHLAALATPTEPSRIAFSVAAHDGRRPATAVADTVRISPYTRGALVLGLLCGLAANARPEGYLLTVILLADVVRRDRPSARTLGAAVLVFLALALPYIVFSLLTTGRPLPTTYYAKASGIGSWTLPLALQYVLVLAYYGLLTNPAALFLAPVGAVVLWRARGVGRIAVAWPALLLLFQALLSPLLYHFGRYAMPVEPFVALFAVFGITRLTRGSAVGGAWRAALPPLALVVVGLLTLNTWAGVYARSVWEIDTMQVAIGGWVRAHVQAGTPVAMNDIGAITYLSGRPAIDVVGLVTPRFIALQREQPRARAASDVHREINRLGGRYLIIFPGWYPELAAQRGLRKLYSVTIQRPIVVGSPTMAVYAVTQ